MNLLERAGLATLRRLDPETAHGLAIKALQAGLTPKTSPPTSERLQTRIAGLTLPNPVGLAAGFDKNAEAVDPLLQSGFGFIEFGGATPLAQSGNPKPRLFRLSEDEAVINRFGFNNDGAEAIAARLSDRKQVGVIGINLGANKTSEDKARDIASVLRTIGPHVDFATVNVSSPNTEKLRDLQGRDALRAVLAQVLEARETLTRPIPIFLKVAPDLTLAEIDDIAAEVSAARLDGVIATNTTLTRDGLRSSHKSETGGLSGQPLKAKSTAILAAFYSRLPHNIPLIGVGGIASGQDAYDKIKAGAVAVQLYSALVFGGLSLATQISRDLDALLARDGYDTLLDAVGTQAEAAASSLG